MMMMIPIVLNDSIKRRVWSAAELPNLSETDEAGDQTGGLIESCTRFKVFRSITRRFLTE